MAASNAAGATAPPLDAATAADSVVPRQVWPAEFAERYRRAGYWRGETIPGFLRQRVQRHPERVAVVGHDGSRWTYAEFWERIETAAAGFLQLGLQPGDRVLVQMGNVPQWLAAVCGVIRAGLIPVFALPAHRLTEVAHFVKTGQVKAYFIPAVQDRFDYRQLARELREQYPDLPVIVAGGDAAEFLSFDDFQPEPGRLPTVDPDPSSVVLMQISGGSTGLPKLIPRTHDDYIYSFRASNEICGITDDSVYLVALPIAHNFPMSSPGFFGAFYAGARVVLATSASPDTVFPLIERERVTDVGLVPPLALLWAQAAEQTKCDLSSLRVMQVGGAKLVPEAARRVIGSLNCRLQQVFGMAEGLVNYTRLDDPQSVIVETQGRPISADDEVLVVDDDDQPLADGQIGHLLTRGPYTIRGYYNDAQANQRSFTADGFYRTGDRVQRTANGYLIVQGRATDHINRAGEKVSAEEVENHLLSHPAVFDAVVVSIPDEHLGERSCAFVITGGDPAVTRPRVIELKNWVRGQGLAAFKVPDQIVFVESFQTTAVGKISRRELRALLRQRYLDNQPTPPPVTLPPASASTPAPAAPPAGLPKLTPYELPGRQEVPAARGPWRIDPARATLLVHDMQRYFLRPFDAAAPPLAAVVANIARLLETARRAAIPVFYTAQKGNQPPRERGLQRDLWGPGMQSIQEHEAVIEALAPQAGDHVLVKHRYSAFQRSELETLIKDSGRDQLVVTGVYTHIGCLATVVEAFQRDIEAFLVADATADFTRQQHLQTLDWVADCCGVPLFTDELIERWS